MVGFMTIIPINQNNADIFDILSQDYEAEFSDKTQKEPDSHGRFILEGDWKSPNSGFFIMVDGKPAGFVIRGIIVGRSDILDFYILPIYRKRGFGKQLAFYVFDHFPGPCR